VVLISLTNSGDQQNMSTRVRLSCVFFILALTVTCASAQKEGTGKKESTSKQKAKGGVAPPISFKKDVFPIIKMNCLPCHTEDEMNPSELYLESYSELMKGGKHGSPVVAGKADSSLIIKKLIPPPPFGDPMPLKRKTGISADTIAVIKRWINQGAKDN
jgi:uncharacterized membrane protein